MVIMQKTRRPAPTRLYLKFKQTPGRGYNNGRGSEGGSKKRTIVKTRTKRRKMQITKTQ